VRSDERPALGAWPHASRSGHGNGHQAAAWVLIGLRLLARGLVRPDGHLQRGVLIALHAKRSAFHSAAVWSLFELRHCSPWESLNHVRHPVYSVRRSLSGSVIQVLKILKAKWRPSPRSDESVNQSGSRLSTTLALSSPPNQTGRKPTSEINCSATSRESPSGPA
jgi:hypothetical protein